MTTLILKILLETWQLLKEMSPYLLFGFFVAGILKIFMPTEFMQKHLSGNGLLTSIKAAFLGVPLPICSCAVIPVTEHLRKNGAGKGALISFLISTPTSGVDSLFATYSLLNLPFTIFRALASFVIGVFAGVITSFKVEAYQGFKTFQASTHEPKKRRLSTIFTYAFNELIDEVAIWLIIGIFAGALISVLLPETVVENYISNSFIAYPIMLLVGIPTYVCSTGSIPIAAALIAKGMSPGAGLVFLIAGPATNTATISFISGKLGFKTLLIYLLSIVLGSISFGLLFDTLISSSISQNFIIHRASFLTETINVISAIILVLLIIKSFFKQKETCNHCNH